MHRRWNSETDPQAHPACRGERWAKLASELQIKCEAASAHGPALDKGRQAPSELRVMEQACAKVRGNCCKAAAQLLGGPSPLPPSEAMAAATLQLFCKDPPGPAQDEAATAPADDAPTVHVGERLVSDRIHRMRVGAQPGGSGMRTGHIKALPLAPGGAGLAQQWGQRWAACSLPAAVAAPFIGLVARPLDKGGGKVRPIFLGEFKCS